MKLVLALSLVLASASAFAGTNPKKAFSQGLTDLVQRMPGDATGADLYCSSASGKTGVFAALPGDLNATAVVIKINDKISADVDNTYVDNSAQREFDVKKELPFATVSKIVQENSKAFNLNSKEFKLVEIAGTSKSKITDGGATGVVHFDALLSTRTAKNIRISCVQDWAL
jgi:hypothetical protein